MTFTFKSFNVKIPQDVRIPSLGTSADVAPASLYGNFAFVLPKNSLCTHILYTIHAAPLSTRIHWYRSVLAKQEVLNSRNVSQPVVPRLSIRKRVDLLDALRVWRTPSEPGIP
jgi:hypothetical protein